MVAKAQPDLWSLVLGTPSIDPDQLVAAIERASVELPLDFRTKLLIRDSAVALSRRWGGPDLFMSRLSETARSAVADILASDLGDPGFSTLEQRLMEHTDPEQILEFLRELGGALPSPARLEIGGSAVLMLVGLLNRSTEDIDVVDEVPDALRAQPQLLDALAKRYGLKLAHFQSHYIPSGWRERLRSLGRFGSLDVYLVDPLDIFVGKLFSNRDKDRDDLRMLKKRFPADEIIDRLRANAGSLLAEPRLRDNAARNWYILYGDELPA